MSFSCMQHFVLQKQFISSCVHLFLTIISHSKEKKINQVYEHSGHKWYFEQENVHTLVETTCLLLSYVRHSHKTIIDIEYEMLYAKTSYSPLLDRDFLTYKRHPILLTVLSRALHKLQDRHNLVCSLKVKHLHPEPQSIAHLTEESAYLLFMGSKVGTLLSNSKLAS